MSSPWRIDLAPLLARVTAAETALTMVPNIIYVGTVDGLPVPSASNVGKYGRVADLFGEKTDLVLCSRYGSSFFWQPVRPTWPNTAAMPADADRTLLPLKSPSIIRLTGSMSATRTLTLSKTGAWPGCSFDVQMTGTLGIFGINIAGLALGATLGLVLNATRRVYFDGTDYQVLG